MKRYPGKLAVGALALFSAAFALFSLQKPKLNWDMIGYVASARAVECHDARILQQDVYSLLRRSVPAEDYAKLTSGFSRQQRVTDPEALRQRLPFYQIRVAYVWTLLALWKLGLNPFFASYLVSVICAVLAIWTLAFLPPGRASPAYWYGVPAIVLLAAFSRVARNSTPDAMAALATLLCYALAFRRNRLLLVALPACVLVRTDLALLFPPFYLYLWWRRTFDRRAVAASALLGLGLYWGVNEAFGNYGWSTIFDYTLVHKSIRPADYPHGVTLATYAGALKSGLVDLFLRPRFLASLAVAVAGLVALRRRRAGTGDVEVSWVENARFGWASSLAYAGLHFLLFPVVWTRFFAGQYALILALAWHAGLQIARARQGKDAASPFP